MDAFAYPLCSKFCKHDLPKPTIKAVCEFFNSEIFTDYQDSIINVSVIILDKIGRV